MTSDRITRIKELLSAGIPSGTFHFEDESSSHSRGGDQTHLKLLVISDLFDGMNRVARQRKVQDLLKQEFSTGLHALSLRCLTVSEAKTQGEFQSPACAGSQDK